MSFPRGEVTSTWLMQGCKSLCPLPQFGATYRTILAPEPTAGRAETCYNRSAHSPVCLPHLLSGVPPEHNSLPRTCFQRTQTEASPRLQGFKEVKHEPNVSFLSIMAQQAMKEFKAELLLELGQPSGSSCLHHSKHMKEQWYSTLIIYRKTLGEML